MVLCLSGVQQAISETISLRSGNVQAKLSYQADGRHPKNLKLKISRNEEVVYNQSLPVGEYDRLLINPQSKQSVLQVS